jgi:hypothetical protein
MLTSWGSQSNRAAQIGRAKQPSCFLRTVRAESVRGPCAPHDSLAEIANLHPYPSVINSQSPKLKYSTEHVAAARKLHRNFAPEAVPMRVPESRDPDENISSDNLSSVRESHNSIQMPNLAGMYLRDSPLLRCSCLGCEGVGPILSAPIRPSLQ